MLFSNSFAQTTKQNIRLLDFETSMPIVKATFQYGKKQGVTDQNGNIQFSLVEDQIMTIYHLSYGTWTLNYRQLKAAVQEKVIYKTKETNDLYPITVIAVKPYKYNPESTLNIEYQDRMEHDAAQILNQLPAFNSIRKGGNYGYDPVFRGFKNDQLNIVFNGAQSATAACPNRMDPPTSQMAPNMIDRIEILKGPYALRYGNAFGATINFIPANLRFTSERDTYGRVSSAYESNGDILRGESQIGFTGDKHDINFFASWAQGNDYTAGNGETIQADFQRGSFGTNMGFRIASNQQVRISAVYNRARDADFPALAMDLRDDDTWMFNVRHDISFTKEHLQSWNTTAYASFVDHLMDNLLKPLEPRMLNASTAAKTYNFGGRTEGFWKFDNSSLYAGADLRIEGAEGTRARTFLMGPMAGNTVLDNAWQEGRISKTGVFSEYQLKGENFNYIISGRLELNQSDINDPSDEFLDIYTETQNIQINPSVSFGLLKDFGSEIKTGLWIGRAQRSGSLTERFINYFPVGQDPFEMLGNPDLNPEINNQMDLTFQWSPNQSTFVNVDVFASYLQDFISSIINPDLQPRLPMSPGVRQYVNIDEAFITGFEISLSQNLFAGLQHQLGIAYTYAQDLEREEPLPEIAPLDIRYVLLGDYFNSRFTPEFTFRYVAEQSRISNEFGETVTPDFSIFDIRLSYKITEMISMTAGVNNILNENYYEHLNRSVRGSNDPIFAPGRNFFVNLNYKF